MTDTVEQYVIELGQVIGLCFNNGQFTSGLFLFFKQGLSDFSRQSWCVPISSSQNKNDGYSADPSEVLNFTL